VLNQEIHRAWEYHDRTKHSYESVRRGGHYLDWSNQPLLFKIYPDLSPIHLPQETIESGAPALAAVAKTAPPEPRAGPPARRDLAHLLYFSAGITRRRIYPNGEILFRAAASTGALYEIELYLVCGDLPDLAAGVYHFGPADFSLRQLRQGDFRGVVAAASGYEPFLAQAPAAIIATGTYWRNAWKYQARTYRHFGWDNGTIHANMLAVSVALGFETRLLCGFVDAEINRLLAVDADREVALTILGIGSGDPAPAPAGVPALHLKTVPPSRREADYPIMREMHAASSLATPEEVIAWRKAAAVPVPAAPAAALTRLTPLADDQIPRDAIEEVILRRGSARRFRRDPITLAQLSTILDRSTRGIPADFQPPGKNRNDLYLIVNAVEGLPAGAYYYHPAAGGLESLRLGDFRAQAAYLALEQELAGDAAVAVFFLADLHRCLGRLGNRGYRAVQLEAGILGGKIYLAAYAFRLGATGLTFYDDDVVNFFAPHAAGKSAIFLVAVGHPARRKT
jgi:SagB-type dehydrogenase family enzyme